MKVDIVQKLSESLNEEKWTRATLNNYIIKNFQTLILLSKPQKNQGNCPISACSALNI